MKTEKLIEMLSTNLEAADQRQVAGVDRQPLLLVERQELLHLAGVERVGALLDDHVSLPVAVSSVLERAEINFKRMLEKILALPEPVL